MDIHKQLPTLSKRMMAIANKVQGEIMADIGTDHGYLAIYAVLNKQVKKAFACDVHKGPLEKAAENVKDWQVGNLVELRLGSGFYPIRDEKVDTAVLSGMGGYLIQNLISQEYTAASRIPILILQPQSEIPLLRKFLHSKGFIIQDEVMVKDMGQFYTVIDAARGEEKPYTDKEYQLGKILLDRKDPVFIDYAKYQVGAITNILKKIQDKNSSAALKRFNELTGLKGLYEEVCG